MTTAASGVAARGAGKVPKCFDLARRSRRERSPSAQVTTIWSGRSAI